MKNFRNALVLWPAFTFASVLTFLASKTLWATGWYWACLSMLGVLCGVLAANVLHKTGLKFWPIVGVTTGLLVGQWWFVQALILRISWMSTGFAP